MYMYIRKRHTTRNVFKNCQKLELTAEKIIGIANGIC